MQRTHATDSGLGRILLAEDDLVSQAVAVRVLAAAGYVVDTVETGQAAIQALQAASYDLVIMDCSMPKMDGFAATRAIRNDTSGRINPDIPVIALTALTFAGDRDRCVEAGMDDYLSKPVDSTMLLAVVGRCLGREAHGEVLASRGAQLRQADWDHDFMDGLIDRFLSEVPSVRASIKQAQACADYGELQRLAHRLRGTADLFQATTVSRRAQALEQAVRAGDTRLANRLVPELVSELRNLQATLSEG